MNKTDTDCRSFDGITVGLIDTIITASRILKKHLKRYYADFEKRYQKDIEPNFIMPEVVYEALKDLHNDDDLFFILQAGPFNKRILNEDSIRITEALINSQNFLIKNVKEPINTLAMYDMQWLEGQIKLLGEDMGSAIEEMQRVTFRVDAMKKHYDALLLHLNNEK